MAVGVLSGFATLAGTAQVAAAAVVPAKFLQALLSGSWLCGPT